MNWWLTVAGLLALLTSAIHVFAGGNDVAKPLLDTPLTNDARYALYACWHFVSVFFVTSALGFLGAGLGVMQGEPGWVVFVSSLWLLFGLVFVGISARVNGVGGIFRLPQWVLLLPVGVLGLLSRT